MSKILYFTVSAIRIDNKAGGSYNTGARKQGLVTVINDTGVERSSYIAVKTARHDTYITHLYKDWYHITSVFVQYEDKTTKTTYFKKDEGDAVYDYVKSLVNIFKEQEHIPEHKNLTVEDYHNVPESAFIDESTFNTGNSNNSNISTYTHTIYKPKKPDIFFLRRKKALPKEELQKVLNSIT